jgi:GNAT superfamily N-acetyltransferase
LNPAEVECVGDHLPLSRLHGAQTYLIAWEGDLPVGHAHVAWTGTTLGSPEIQDVFVSEANRRHGVGTELTRAAEQLAAPRGYNRISLSYGIANDAAQALYRSLSYCDSGLEPRRVQGTVLIRDTPVEVDDTLIYLVKEIDVDSGAPHSS